MPEEGRAVDGPSVTNHECILFDIFFTTPCFFGNKLCAPLCVVTWTVHEQLSKSFDIENWQVCAFTLQRMCFRITDIGKNVFWNEILQKKILRAGVLRNFEGQASSEEKDACPQNFWKFWWSLPSPCGKQVKQVRFAPVALICCTHWSSSFLSSGFAGSTAAASFASITCDRPAKSLKYSLREPYEWQSAQRALIEPFWLTLPPSRVSPAH
jgi:hypothetical protein